MSVVRVSGNLEVGAQERILIIIFHRAFLALHNGIAYGLDYNSRKIISGVNWIFKYVFLLF